MTKPERARHAAAPRPAQPQAVSASPVIRTRTKLRSVPPADEPSLALYEQVKEHVTRRI